MSQSALADSRIRRWLQRRRIVAVPGDNDRSGGVPVSFAWKAIIEAAVWGLTEISPHAGC